MGLTTLFFCSIAGFLVVKLDMTKKYEIRDSDCHMIGGQNDERGFED